MRSDPPTSIIPPASSFASKLIVQKGRVVPTPNDLSHCPGTPSSHNNALGFPYASIFLEKFPNVFQARINQYCSEIEVILYQWHQP
jgi:hypothetical protein